MFQVQTNGVLAETHVNRDEATLAAIRLKEAGRHQLVTVHDTDNGHFWTIGGTGRVAPMPDLRHEALRVLRGLNAL